MQSIFNLQVDLMLSAGALEGKPSSIIDLSGDEPEIIREGAGDISMFLLKTA
jgi:tRNA A37 threonylcarbamoyladenosine synthetase subunit TsaC/SUA5/YrdC